MSTLLVFTFPAQDNVGIGVILKLLSLVFILVGSRGATAASTTIVTVETVMGTFEMELLTDQAPLTVANFLNYLNRGDYDGTFFHRSEPGFVVQGGGFFFDEAADTVLGINTDLPVINEFGVSNTRGTVAMAKLGGDPDSATSQWFVNLADNSANLDAQNGGFTVFARVINDGMDVVDAIAALPRVDFGGTFSSTPTINFTGNITPDIFVVIERMSVVVDNASRLGPPKVIELPVAGVQLTSPFGPFLTVPSSVSAVALNVTAVDPTAAGFITVWPCGVARPLASNLNYVAGDIVANGVIASVGSPGSVCLYSQKETDLIVDIAGWFEGTAYVGATPTRLVDTRDGTGGVLGQVTASSPMTIQVTDLLVVNAAGASTTIPSSIGAVALNVTVVQPSASGFVTLWPCDVSRPLSSNVNYTRSSIVANGVIAPVSAAGTVCLYSQAPTDVIVDLAGWFPGQSFTGTTPTRLADTRDGTGGRTGAITSADVLSIPIHNITLNVGGVNQQVPGTATAAALNVTVVNPTRSGFATVWPCGVSRPLASNLNFTVGQVVANNVVAPVGNDSSVCLFSNVSTDIVVDIAGWFSSDVSGAFVGSTPERFVDTRDGTGPVPE